MATAKRRRRRRRRTDDGLASACRQGSTLSRTSAGPAKSDRTRRLAAAAQRLGIARLYPEQERIIEHVMGGGDALVVLPTGFGKSICYQLPSLLLPLPSVVVSPLLALLQDQYDRLLRRKVPVARLDSTVRGRSRAEALERIGRGGPLLVMTTAETLGTDEMARALCGSGVALVAVDEAHAVSEWGHDFRPAYMRLGEVLARYGGPPILALTATATEAVRQDIVRILSLDNPLSIVRSPHRPNLRLEVIECGGAERLRALTRLVLHLPRPGIVYCATTRDVDAVYGALGKLRIPIHHYHGRMSGAERRTEQDAFMQRGRRAVMVATSAFGLGIDKPDIRYVVHFHAPASLEQYVQEAGRAGRDGKRADCVLLYSSEDRQIHEYLLSQSRTRPDQLIKVGKALAAWADEGRAPDITELSASAGLAQRVALALVALLEQDSAVALEPDGKVKALLSGSELLERCRAFGAKLDHIRKLDAVRLDAVATYAMTRRCRAQQLRDYFGVPAEGPCGVCDVCRARPERPESFFRPLTRRRGKRGKSPRAVHAGRSAAAA